VRLGAGGKLSATWDVGAGVSADVGFDVTGYLSMQQEGGERVA